VTEVPSALDRWTASHCRVARRLFEVCGKAGASDPSPDVALALTSLAGQFAWHAELLFDLLPARPGIDADALVAAPVRGVDAGFDRLDELADTDGAATLCVVLARVVVPRLLAAARAARSRTDALVDGPRARALTLIVRDLRDALELLEALAERAIAADGPDRSMTWCLQVERGLVDAGAVVGLVAEQ
jgi:hypothetical protein